MLLTSDKKREMSVEKTASRWGFGQASTSRARGARCVRRVACAPRGLARCPHRHVVAMQKVRTGGNVVLNWSPNLQNGEKLERPELTRIFSNSRTGRTDWHRNQFVPLPSRPPPEKPPEEYVAPKHRRHLIYLALYRDKVDQHQAAVLAATTGAVPSSPTQAEAAQNLAATTGHFPVESQDSRRSARDMLEPALAAHTAAVKASGIGLDEHVEVKRLGKLFDEWIEMTQQDVDEVYEKLGLNREGSKTLRPRAAKPGGKGKSWRGWNRLPEPGIDG
eukprot:s1120_g13.t1